MSVFQVATSWEVHKLKDQAREADIVLFKAVRTDDGQYLLSHLAGMGKFTHLVTADQLAVEHLIIEAQRCETMTSSWEKRRRLVQAEANCRVRH